MDILNFLGPSGRRRRLFGERGSSAVEAVVVTPVVMLMMFGILELGFIFKDYLAVSGAVRSGVRIASANPRTSTFAQVAANQLAETGGAANFADVDQMWVYKASSATGLPDSGSFAGCTTCVKFRWDSGSKAFVVTSDNWPASSQNACVVSAGGPPDKIGVYVRLKHQPFTGLIFQTLYISESSVLGLEPMPAAVGCKP